MKGLLPYFFSDVAKETYISHKSHKNNQLYRGNLSMFDEKKIICNTE